MKTKLDRLLESIHPSRNLEQVDARADAAINTFRINTGVLTVWDDFTYCLVTFFEHMERRILRLPYYPNTTLEYTWGRCVTLLNHAYGPNGEKAAFERARTGIDGGLYAVLKAIARGIAEQYAGNEISARISAYWNELSVEERLNASTEYLSKFGHLLPSELTEGSAARVRANLPKVLEQHPHLIQRLHRVGR